MYYINFKGGHGTQTVDEAKTLKEAKYLVKEYNLAFGGGSYISQRSTKEWGEQK